MAVTFSYSEWIEIAQALRVAAERYDADARAAMQESSMTEFAEAARQSRVEQFTRQAQLARARADVIEEWAE